MPGPRSAPVTAIAEPITIDGVLDEPVWSSAPTIGDLIQRQPTEGAAPTERTDVTLLDDGDHLYVGVVAYDSEPERVIGTQMARDARLGSDDRIEILLDTFRDQRSAFYFATNPSGALVDGLVANGQLNTDWDAIWDVRTRRTDRGMDRGVRDSVQEPELSGRRGPCGASTSPATSIASWRRTAGRARASTRSSSRCPRRARSRTSSGLTQGIGLDVRPFLAGRWLHVRTATATTTRQAGPRRVLQHHAQPEADRDLQHRLRRDRSRRAPDQPLALLGAVSREARRSSWRAPGVFSFASTGPEPAGGIPPTGADVYPFFSRQIGLLRRRGSADRRRRQADRHRRPHRRRRARRAHRRSSPAIVERQELLRRPRQAEPVPAVVRRRDLHRRPSRARAVGPDLRRRHAPGDVALPRPAAATSSSTPTPCAASTKASRTRDWSYGFSAHYPNDRFNAQVAFREIQENFKPALGFVQRDNVRLLRTAAATIRGRRTS